jgi:circadian clock protein KaiB
MTSAAKFDFRLYVAGEGPNSIMAIAKLKALCRDLLPDCHQIEIIDVVEFPLRALEDSVLLTPTLLKLSPKPVRRIVGNLSDTQTVLQTLGLEAQST